MKWVAGDTTASLGQRLVVELRRLGLGPDDEFTVAPAGEPREPRGPQQGGARRSDKPTVKAAAASMDPTRQQQQVLEVMRAAGRFGVTADETWDRCDPQHEKGRDSWVPRLNELAVKRLAVAPEGFKRMGQHGREQQVYVATGLPPDAAEQGLF